MDGFQFISSLVASVAWPVAAVGMALSLRGPIVSLMGRATSAEGFGAKLTFSEKVAEALEAIESAQPSSTNPGLPLQGDGTTAEGPTRESSPVDELTDELASTSATGTIIVAWSKLERELKELAASHGVVPAHPVAFANLQRLRQEGILSDDTVAAIGSLRQLRNQIAHGFERETPSLATAASYRAAVDSLVATLRTLRNPQAGRR